jgi:class 3 adenylate cyclase
MQQIADWLEKLGMSEYAQRFAENRIDFSVLRDLTDQDLKDLGVVLGDRRKMLRAIGELAVATAPSPKPTPAAEAKSQETAERRQVTVMFSDLVGSTALSARMDPEDLREVISAYQKCVAETVQRFGGFVAKYMGDGVLVYFGYPQAHEDDAERAVHAGLELVAAATALKTHAPLQTRVGIATGLVVVGDLNRIRVGSLFGDFLAHVPVLDHFSVLQPENIDNGVAARARRRHVVDVQNHVIAVGEHPLDVTVIVGKFLAQKGEESF